MTRIRYFKIVGEVIEDAIQFIASDRNVPRDEVYRQVVNYIQTNCNEWFSNRRPNIDYADPVCRIAYMYHTVPANANLIETVLEDPELEPYLDQVRGPGNRRIRIGAFGGGPGTELLGFAKNTEKRGLSQQLRLDFVLMDRVNEWAGAWHALHQRIEDEFQGSATPCPVSISGVFTRVDITDTASIGNLDRNLFTQDLFFLSYVISEVFEGFRDLRAFTSRVAQLAPQGSKFVFFDRNGPRWKAEVQRLASEAGLTLSDFHNDTSGRMGPDEHPSDLGQILTDVGVNPRTNWNAFWVVGTKT